MFVRNANEALFWCENCRSRVDITSLFPQTHDADTSLTTQQHTNVNAFAFGKEVSTSLLYAELGCSFVFIMDSKIEYSNPTLHVEIPFGTQRGVFIGHILTT